MTRSKVDDDLATLQAKRGRLKQELKNIQALEKAARLAKADAGREPLMAALSRVKISAMDKEQAKAIATAIGTLEPHEIVRLLRNG